MSGRTPEELDALLEDAFVLEDGAAAGELFAADAVLAVGGRRASGPRIGPLLSELTRTRPAHVADPRAVVQAGDLALLVDDRTVSVAQRAAPGRGWRFAIALIDPTPRRGRQR